MKLFQLFRKPQLSYFLSFLILFMSCNQYESEEINDTYNADLSLEQFLTLHNELGADLLNLINSKDNNIDFTLLQSLGENAFTIDDWEENFIQSGIEGYEEFFSVLKQMELNAKFFVDSNPEYNSLSEKEIELLLINNFELQTNLTSKGDCEDDREKWSDRCGTAYLIGMGASLVSSIVSFGVGTVIGFSATQAAYLTCIYNVEKDYRECVGE